MTSADSVPLRTLEARGELSPPDRIHTQARLTPDNQEQRTSRRRECRKAVSSAPSEFTLANGTPGPCPSTRDHGRPTPSAWRAPRKSSWRPGSGGTSDVAALAGETFPPRPLARRPGCRSLASRETCERVRTALPPGSWDFPASGSRPVAARASPSPGGAQADLESSEVCRAVRPRVEGGKGKDDLTVGPWGAIR
ncbi:uncharacterized protein [Kogia breviceps]